MSLDAARADAHRFREERDDLRGQLYRTREDLQDLRRERDKLGADRHDALARCRAAAQILIAEIGASGPEDVEETARRAVERIQELKGVAMDCASQCDDPGCPVLLREEHAAACMEADRLRAELDAARAKLEEAKRAALVGWWSVCAANTWGFDSRTDHVAALLHHGQDLLGDKP